MSSQPSWLKFEFAAKRGGKRAERARREARDAKQDRILWFPVPEIRRVQEVIRDLKTKDVIHELKT